MSLYGYQVIDTAGRHQRGDIEASDATRAAEILRQRGDTVLEVEPVVAAGRTLKFESTTSLNDRQIADFAHELQALMASGISLSRALGTISEGARTGKRASLARDLKLYLELGHSLSEGFNSARSSGLRLFGRFLAAAEQGGRYDVMLMLAARFLERRAMLAEKVRSALSYPAFLLIISVGAVFFLIVFVAPTIGEMFEGTEAPIFIKVAAGVGAWVQLNARLLLVVLAAILGSLVLFRRTFSPVAAIARAFRATPGVGRVWADLEFGSGILAYAALHRAGWPAERALRLAASVSEPRAAASFHQVAEQLRDGLPLAKAFRSAKGIPTEIVGAVEIGEAAGGVPDAVERTGELLIQRATKIIERTAEIAAPALIAAIGALVALLMISMLSSLGSLGDAVL
jgi:type II secretory pathway component PulF